MQQRVFLLADNVSSPLAFTTGENFRQVVAGNTALKSAQIPSAIPITVCAGIIDTEILNGAFNKLSGGAYTRFEKLCILSIHEAIARAGIDITSRCTALIISTTKGNIDLLSLHSPPEVPQERLYLAVAARAIGSFFGNPNNPLVISNACISGVTALITGMRLIRFGHYDHVIVCGGDIINEFTVSGFQSFKALSDEPCRPFDKDRTGLNLGEAFGTVVLSREQAGVEFLGGAGSNDANHLSGPSRTGAGLKTAITKSLEECGLSSADIDLISAHGTATPYNDEMEAIAFDDLGFGNTPVNSLKGNFGHTLGGAGLVEVIMNSWCIQEQMMVATCGYEHHGVSRNIQVTRETHSAPVNTVLKTASGFGGCNAAIIFRKA